jgi:DNA-directed RNA polymerase, mitochondrial
LTSAARFRKIIREQFVGMYKEHDVLSKVLECARRDLGAGVKLPEPPERGELDIEEVRKAEYAFARRFNGWLNDDAASRCFATAH